MSEKYVVSLDLAKRMKELGFKQESDYYWQRVCDDEADVIYDNRSVELRSSKNTNKIYQTFSAYHVGELGEMLPQILKIKGVSYQLFVSVALDKQWFVVYADETDYHNNAPFPFMMCHSEADARAKMLIHLVENNLLTPTK